MLLRAWSDQPYRATRDLDLLRKGDGSFDAIRKDIETICSAEIEPDAVVFDPASIQIEAIRVEDEYAGVRVMLPACCAAARLKLQIDIGLGDSVWPPVERRKSSELLLERGLGRLEPPTRHSETLAIPQENGVVVESFGGGPREEVPLQETEIRRCRCEPGGREAPGSGPVSR